jgi:type IV pilus assembly protein PilM
MADRVMTLYLEDNSIKLLVAKGRQVERWVSVPLEPGLINGGVIENENQVADKINEAFTAIKHVKRSAAGKKSFWKNLGGGKGKLIVGLSGRDSLYRVLGLPVLVDAQLAEAVQREAGRVLPVSLDELYLSYQRIPGFANESRVFAAAYPKKTTETLLRTLRIAGMMPRMLDLAPLALCLSVNEPRSIIVDVRQDNLNIIVMAGRVPQVIRSLALQSEDKTISENLPTIIEEFSRTVAFYNSSHQQEPLDGTVPVFVSSDLANAPDSWKALVGKLEAPVAVLPSVLQYPADFPANEFAVNLGLATKELNLEKEAANYSLVNLNALPESAKPKYFNPYRVLVPVVAVVGLAGIVLMWLNLQNNLTNNDALESQLSVVQNTIQKSAGDVAKLTEQNRQLEAQIQPIIDAASVFSVKLSSLAEARLRTDSDLHQIVALKPGTVAMTGVNYAETAMTVNGVSGTYTSGNHLAILSYANALRETGGFNMVVSTISYSSEVTDKNEKIESYQFNFQVK